MPSNTKPSKEFDKRPKIHPGRLIKVTPLEVFQQSEFSQNSLMQLKDATKKRQRGAPREKKREKRAWELRTNDGSNFFQPPTQHLSPEEEEMLANEQEAAIQAQQRELELRKQRTFHRLTARSEARKAEQEALAEEDEEEEEEEDDDAEMEEKGDTIVEAEKMVSQMRASIRDERSKEELTPPSTPAKPDPTSPAKSESTVATPEKPDTS